MDWVQIEGRSMHPLLLPGDWVGIEWLQPELPHRHLAGDLVLSKDSDGIWIVHRLVAATDEGAETFFLKGDSSLEWEKIHSQQIWGKVVAIRGLSRSKISQLDHTRLDRWIAYLSYKSAPGKNLRGKFLRLAARALAGLRRSRL